MMLFIMMEKVASHLLVHYRKLHPSQNISLKIFHHNVGSLPISQHLHLFKINNHNEQIKDRVPRPKAMPVAHVRIAESVLQIPGQFQSMYRECMIGEVNYIVQNVLIRTDLKSVSMLTSEHRIEHVHFVERFFYFSKDIRKHVQKEGDHLPKLFETSNKSSCSHQSRRVGTQSHFYKFHLPD